MSRLNVYKEEAIRLTQNYSGEVPFAVYLKKYLSGDRRKGSRDRKMISELCYIFFRVGHLFAEKTIEERLNCALFLTQQEKNLLTSLLPQDLEERLSIGLDDKLQYLQIDLSVSDLFPFKWLLSHGVEPLAFQKSFLKQPLVFVRIRPGFRSTVEKTLQLSGLKFEYKSEECVALASGSKLEQWFQINKEVVVQDASSQKIIPYLSETFSHHKSISVWDCCAASGGKSIHLHDLFPEAKLTVSDIRASILKNLEHRFREAGIRNYTSTVIDLSRDIHTDKQFDLVIADVPCSGSGTWRRTPEQLHFFKEMDIDQYVTLQRKIITNIIPSLKTGGYLLYSTCSAFAKENEYQCCWIEQAFGLDCIKSTLIDGTAIQADTMYAALFQKK